MIYEANLPWHVVVDPQGGDPAEIRSQNGTVVARCSRDAMAHWIVRLVNGFGALVIDMREEGSKLR